MKFYHFTSRYYVRSIFDQGRGINRGDVPLSPQSSVNGVWLTTEGRRHRQRYNRASRFAGPDGVVHMHDKAEIRLTIELESEELVLPWPEVVRRLGIDPSYASWLNDAGNETGNLWWVAFRPILPSEVARVELDVRGNGAWHEVPDVSVFTDVKIISLSSWEIETGEKLQRVPLEEVLERLVA